MNDFREQAIKDVADGIDDHVDFVGAYVDMDNSEDDYGAAVAYAVAQRERVLRLEAALRWVNGEGDDFPERQPGQGAFWWRTELRKRTALYAGKETAIP